MIGNCQLCGDKFYLNYYPLKTVQIPIQCPRCHGTYSLIVRGEIENFVRVWFEYDPELIDRLADYYYYVPPEDLGSGRFPDLETEYATDTSCNSSLVRNDFHTHGQPYSSNYPNDTARTAYWDSLLDSSFKTASFNLSHLHRKKRDQISNFIFG
jgi:hypothetical protein